MGRSDRSLVLSCGETLSLLRCVTLQRLLACARAWYQSSAISVTFRTLCRDPRGDLRKVPREGTFDSNDRPSKQRCGPVTAGAARCRPMPPDAVRCRPVPPGAVRCRPVPPGAARCRAVPPGAARCRAVPPAPPGAVRTSLLCTILATYIPCGPRELPQPLLPAPHENQGFHKEKSRSITKKWVDYSNE
jgi:hypothetical protein